MLLFLKINYPLIITMLSFSGTISQIRSSLRWQSCINTNRTTRTSFPVRLSVFI